MSIDHVIFDKDGTLIDIHFYWVGMIQMRAETLSSKFVAKQQRVQAINDLKSNMGIDLLRNKIKPDGPVGIEPRSKIIENAYFSLKEKYTPSISRNNVSEVFQEVDELSIKYLDKIIKPLPGVKKTLEFLKLNNVLISIATTDLTERATIAMKFLNLDKYFDFIVGGDMVKKTKPSADLANLLVNKSNIPANKSLIIGDSEVDLKMAEAAKIKFLGVATGLTNASLSNKRKNYINDLTFFNNTHLL